MGAGASIGDEPIDKARAEELAGDQWGKFEAQFDAVAVAGVVQASQVLAWQQPAACPIGVARASQNDSLSKYLQATKTLLDKPVAVGTEGETRPAVLATAADMADASVTSMMGMIKGIPTLADQALDEKIRSSPMTSADLEARHAARRLKIREVRAVALGLRAPNGLVGGVLSSGA